IAGVEYLVATSAGRAAFLVVGVGGGEEGGFLAEEQEEGVGEAARDGLRSGAVRALSLLRFPPEIERAVERAYPEKASALVVGSLEEALERSRAAEAAGGASGAARTFVTLAGEQVRNGRVIVGGSAAAQGANLLGIKR